jgi:transcriptional regulator of acetoin/glycerol metabolism
MPLGALAALPRIGAEVIRLRNGLQVWVRADMRARDGHEHLHPVASQAHEWQAATPRPHADARKTTATPDEDFDQATEVTPPTPAAVAAPTSSLTVGAATLRDADLDVIQRTLDECRGNIARAAKILQVSRGLIYRRLKAANPTAH